MIIHVIGLFALVILWSQTMRETKMCTCSYYSHDNIKPRHHEIFVLIAHALMHSLDTVAFDCKVKKNNVTDIINFVKHI